MDLIKEILQEHSRRQAVKIADYVGDNHHRFKALVDAYIKGPYRVTQRGAWPLSLCIERNPSLIKPHLKKIIRFLYQPGIHNAVKRNTMRLLQFCEIPKQFHGEIVSLCFQYLEQKSEPIAVKVFAMTVLSNIIKNEPDLKKELQIILEDQLPYASPGFTVRAKKVLREIA